MLIYMTSLNPTINPPPVIGLGRVRECPLGFQTDRRLGWQVGLGRGAHAVSPGDDKESAGAQRGDDTSTGDYRYIPVRDKGKNSIKIWFRSPRIHELVVQT